MFDGVVFELGEREALARCDLLLLGGDLWFLL
jgi:hypothetical protein